MKRTHLFSASALSLLLLAPGILRATPAAENGAGGAANASLAPIHIPESQFSDVMDGRMPPLPKFPKLAKKRGFLRGYVKDRSGKPLAGAYIMILPPTVFGSGLSKRSITMRTDADGLYEIPVPSGGCTVWCAGYAVNYHGVRYALPLHPVDGSLDSIPVDKGDIENFVLLSYGVANESTVSENPAYSGGYYGATFTLSYSAKEPDDASYPYMFNLGSDIEVTLTPDGPLLDGSTGRTLIFHKKASYTYMQVNNIPIGKYKIRVRVTDRGQNVPVKLKDTTWAGRKGGMTPPETTDSATILFRSGGGDPQVLRVPGGGMDRHSLTLEKVM